MTITDKNYLRLQFMVKVYEKNGTEYQSFFESIALLAIEGFVKIKPLGNKGDGGNDGFVRDKGIYYQAYSPINPLANIKNAKKKLANDFNKLKENWNQISNIKEFYFVFNDKGLGSDIIIEQELQDLKEKNPNIEFRLLLSTDLEKLFFTLSSDDHLALGFDVNNTKSVEISFKILNEIELYIDRGCGEQAISQINQMFDMITELNNHNLILKRDTLRARALLLNEKQEESKYEFERIGKLLGGTEAILYLAESCLNDKEYERNEYLLNQVEAQFPNNSLLQIEKLIRKYRLSEQIDLREINEAGFPDDHRLKSNLYRLYALFYERAGSITEAYAFISKAIQYNPDKLINYIAEISILLGRLVLEKEKFNEKSDEYAELKLLLQDRFERLDKLFLQWGNISHRLRFIINLKRLYFHLMNVNIQEVKIIAENAFDSLLNCQFDHFIEELMIDFITMVHLPSREMVKLKKYIHDSKHRYSDSLSRGLIIHFISEGSLFSEGIEFFRTTSNTAVLTIIDSFQNKKYDTIIKFFEGDFPKLVALSNFTKDHPDLIERIIALMPNEEHVIKAKLELLFNINEGDNTKAFEIMKGLEINKLNYSECMPILKLASQKEAWDYVIQIADRLLLLENDEDRKLEIKLARVNAFYNLEMYPDMIQSAEEILNSGYQKSLSNTNSEWLLAQIIIHSIKRRNIDLKGLLTKYDWIPKSFKFKAFVEAESFIRLQDGENALKAVIEGLKLTQKPTSEEYAHLFMVMNSVATLTDLGIESEEYVIDSLFVKLSGLDRWFLIGDTFELDAIRILSNDSKYGIFIGKAVGDEVQFEAKYRTNPTKHVIEFIYSIEKYVYWKSMYEAKKLTLEYGWNQMELIDIPQNEEGMDFSYIIARLKEDYDQGLNFLDMYCSGIYPAAFLSLNEGNFTNAIAKLIQEQRGFIHCATGELEEINEQKAVALRLIQADDFYIDGTSIFFLAESGMLEKIHTYLPNMRVPQSVISLLINYKEKISDQVGHSGFISYAKGGLRYNRVEEERRKLFENRFINAIEILEKNSSNIRSISQATKHDCFSEQKVHNEFCDACILAQRDGCIVLTDDYIYLHANSLETNKDVPDYCSSFALVRTLYELGKIGLDDYLEFFHYLTSYRLRFLPISPQDLIDAIIGKGPIYRMEPEKIRLFNLKLVLSKEYGVSTEFAHRLICYVVHNFIIDDSVLPDTMEKIFIEVLENLPLEDGLDKKGLARSILGNCIHQIQNQRNIIIYDVRPINVKLERLKRLIPYLR